MTHPAFFGNAPAPDPKYPKIVSAGFEAFRDLETDSIKGITSYDPSAYSLEDKGHILELGKDAVVMNAWHPGNVDYFVYQEGDYGPNALNYIAKAVRESGVDALDLTEALEGVSRELEELKRDAEAIRQQGARLADAPVVYER